MTRPRSCQHRLHRRRLGVPARRPTPPAASPWSPRAGDRAGDPADPGHGPRRAADAARVRLPHPRPRVRPANAATAGQIAYDVREALERWEPRIDVLEVGVELRRGSEPATLYIDVSYEIRGQQRPAQPGLPVLRHPRARGAAPGGCGHSPPNAGRFCLAEVSDMLPAPNLDDRQFQDLVDDAKRLVQQRCPEWTDHNVSDPGVTLIEAFAQMVDQLIYRLNRVPDRNYIKFLELIGVELRPPAAARGHVDVLAVRAAAADRAGPRRDRGGHPAHRHPRPGGLHHHSRAGDRAVHVRPCRRRQPTSPPPVDTTMALGRGGFRRFQRHARCRRRAADRAVERGAVLRGAAPDGLPVSGGGVDPRRPPLVWEAWTGAGWTACEVDQDETGGLNKAGDVVLHVPDEPPDLDHRPGAGRLAALPAGREPARTSRRTPRRRA